MVLSNMINVWLIIHLMYVFVLLLTVLSYVFYFVNILLTILSRTNL